MTLAEQWLRERGIPPERWAGAQVHHAENTPEGMWGSVVMELERRGDDWIVTRLDRELASGEYTEVLLPCPSHHQMGRGTPGDSSARHCECVLSMAARSDRAFASPLEARTSSSAVMACTASWTAISCCEVIPGILWTA